MAAPRPGAPAGPADRQAARGTSPPNSCLCVGRMPSLHFMSPQTCAFSPKTFPNPRKTSRASRELSFYSSPETSHSHSILFGQFQHFLHYKTYNWETQETYEKAINVLFDDVTDLDFQGFPLKWTEYEGEDWDTPQGLRHEAHGDDFIYSVKTFTS